LETLFFQGINCHGSLITVGKSCNEHVGHTVVCY
jgi:hypothetical protein